MTSKTSAKAAPRKMPRKTPSKTQGAGWSLKDISAEARAAVLEAAKKDGVAPGVWVDRILLAAAQGAPAPSPSEAPEEALAKRINTFTDKLNEGLKIIGKQIRDEARTAYEQMSDKGDDKGDAKAGPKKDAPSKAPSKDKPTASAG